MDNITELNKIAGETELQYLWRIDNLIRSGKYKNWDEVTPIINKEIYGDDETEYKGESAFRKKCKYARDFFEDGVFSKYQEDAYFKELELQKRELERTKVQFRDERNAWNRTNYIEGRVEAKLDKLEEEIKAQGKIDYEVNNHISFNSDNDILVILSDMHIGQCFSSYFGKYDSDIAKNRLEEYLSNIFEIQKLHNSENCYVSLQGDLISNSIHKAIAITNRENVIEQIKLASELIASFVHKLSSKFNMVYITSVTGNHSRIDRKEDALHDERLDSLPEWYVEAKLNHVKNVHIIKEKIDSSISIMTIRGLVYVNVHGDFDPFNKGGVANLVLMLGFKPYAITYGHKHTPAIDEVGGIKMIRGGSLSGSGDDYTIEKRLSGKPSQMACVCTDKGIKPYYVIELI